jgi:hypothetical protein
MSDSKNWQAGPPALGTVIVKLLSLQARMLRVEAAQRLQRAAKTVKLLKG